MTSVGATTADMKEVLKSSYRKLKMRKVIMDTKQIKEDKHKLELDIKNLLDAFHNTHKEVKINNVNIEFTDIYSDNASMPSVIFSKVALKIFI